MSDSYILKGHAPVPVDGRTWSRWLSQSDEIRRVALDEIGDVRISIVFLGLDHGYGDGPPLMFETMVFGGKHDEYQERYSTWAEAEAGHAATVVLVTQTVWPSTPDA